MGDAPLILTPDVVASLRALRSLAVRRPVDVRRLMETIKTPEGETAHRARMTEQSVTIPGPWPFVVVFSIETGHGAGVCRHMSMSVMREGRVPSREAMLMVAEVLGFTGDLAACRGWTEALRDGGTAINLVQPIAVREVGHG